MLARTPDILDSHLFIKVYVYIDEYNYYNIYIHCIFFSLFTGTRGLWVTGETAVYPASHPNAAQGCVIVTSCVYVRVTSA